MKKYFIIATLLIGVLVGASTLSVIAQSSGWTPPTANPPGGNVPPPINVGSILQEKVGGLWLKSGLRVDGNVLIATGTPSAGKVLTALDSIGTVTWANASSTGGGTVSINLPTCTEGQTLKMVSGAWSCVDMIDTGGSGSSVITGAGIFENQGGGPHPYPNLGKDWDYVKVELSSEEDSQNRNIGGYFYKQNGNIMAALWCHNTTGSFYSLDPMRSYFGMVTTTEKSIDCYSYVIDPNLKFKVDSSGNLRVDTTVGSISYVKFGAGV